MSNPRHDPKRSHTENWGGEQAKIWGIPNSHVEATLGQSPLVEGFGGDYYGKDDVNEDILKYLVNSRDKTSPSSLFICAFDNRIDNFIIILDIYLNGTVIVLLLYYS